MDKPRGALEILIAMGLLILIGVGSTSTVFFQGLQNKKLIQRMNRMEAMNTGEMMAWTNYYATLSVPLSLPKDSLGRQTATLDNNYSSSVSLPSNHYAGGQYVMGTPLNLTDTLGLVPDRSEIVRRYDGTNLHLMTQGTNSCGDQTFNGKPYKTCLATISPNSNTSNGNVYCSGMFPGPNMVQAAVDQYGGTTYIPTSNPVNAEPVTPIASQADLQSMKYNGNYRLDADITVSSLYASNSNGIGNFIFDGNHHTISFDQPTGFRNGLFGPVNSAVIKDLTLQGSSPTVRLNFSVLASSASSTCVDNVTIQNINLGAFTPAGSSAFFFLHDFFINYAHAAVMNEFSGFGSVFSSVIVPSTNNSAMVSPSGSAISPSIPATPGWVTYYPPTIIANSKVINVTAFTADKTSSGEGYTCMGGSSLMVGGIEDGDAVPYPALIIYNSSAVGTLTGFASCGTGFLLGKASGPFQILDSWASGKETASVYTAINTNADGTTLGGLVGFASSNFSISDSYSLVSISGRGVSGGVGRGPAGGLLGASYCYSCYPSSTCAISRSFSAGTLKNAVLMGGVVGFVGYQRMGNNAALMPTSITDTYWDTTLTPGLDQSGQTMTNDALSASGRPTSSLQTASTYQSSTWDMVRIWNSPNSSYPTLRTNVPRPGPVRLPSGQVIRAGTCQTSLNGGAAGGGGM